MTEKEIPAANEGFAFTKREELYNRVSHERFQALIGQEQTVVHKIEIDTNSFGEFTFVTASRPATAGKQLLTFWGLGYNEHRERWIHREWFWYRAHPDPETFKQRLLPEQAAELLQVRQVEIAPYLASEPQSNRGKLFEMLADLTDEDGALAEIEDLENWLGDFDDL